MPSFQDSAVIFFLALLLFGPKKLPELARQLGKLMGEFRRASNEFRMQMEDELRVSEQEEKRKQIAAIEAAAPVAPALSAGGSNTIAAPSATESAQAIANAIEDPLDSHPHMAPPDRSRQTTSGELTSTPTPVPIATSGDLSLMPPATGLPLARSASSSPASPAPASPSESAALSPVFDSIPAIEHRNGASHPEHSLSASAISDETVTHG